MAKHLLTLLSVAGLLVSSVSADAACTGASPTWTCPPDYTSISRLVDTDLAIFQPPGFTSGDTVNVTAGDGTETWPTYITVRKGINLVGPGRDNLIISGGNTASGMLNFHPDAATVTANKTVRVTGFTFDGGGTSLKLINFTGADNTDTGPFQKLIIETNRFKNLSTASGSAGAVYTAYQTRGVIADNIFDRVGVVGKALGRDNTLAEWTNGKFPFAFGDGDNLFWEDNVIQWSSAMPGVAAPGYIESGQGGRSSLRYNTWDYTNLTIGSPDIWDQHGFQGWTNHVAGVNGTMITENYGNVIVGGTIPSPRLSVFRGSTGILFNNTGTGAAASMSLEAVQYDRGCNAQINASWPPPNGQINAVYTFNNTWNGTAKHLVLKAASGDAGTPANPFDDYNNDCPPAENSEFWNYNAACTDLTCAAGIGRGTVTPTGTCTVGTGYWKASTATPLSIGANATGSSATNRTTNQASTLYKCTSTNTWTVLFTPYTYPHPLRTVTNPLPTAPTNLRATMTSGTTCTLTWVASSGATVVGYHVYRGIASGIYTTFSTKTPTLAITTHSSVTTATADLPVAGTYYFTVTGFDANGIDGVGTAEASCVSTGLSRTAVGGNILASDSMDTDGATMGANWSNNSVTTTFQRVTGLATVNGSTDAAARYSGITWPNDQRCSVIHNKVLTSGGLGAGYGCAVRMSTSGTTVTYYRFVCSTAGWELGKNIADAFTSLATSTTACANGDVTDLQVVGTTLTAYINNVLVTTKTDSSIASGAAGVAYSSNGGDTTFGITYFSGSTPGSARRTRQ